MLSTSLFTIISAAVLASLCTNILCKKQMVGTLCAAYHKCVGFTMLCSYSNLHSDHSNTGCMHYDVNWNTMICYT